MSQKLFPKELLAHIKGYEHSLISYGNYKKEKLTKIIVYNIYQPWYLRGSAYHKSNMGQLDYIFSSVVSPSVYQYISKEEITTLVIDTNTKAANMAW